MRGAYYNEIDEFAAEWLRNLISAGLIPAGDVDTRSIRDVQPDDLVGYVQCHFFAGIGGWGLSARLAGWPDDRPLWTGSCPCQPFSAAGKRGGSDDPRHLWPDFFRLIRARRPAVVVGEQVAGALGYGWFDGVSADLAGEGYASRAVDVPACAVDAPHIRNRLWWLAVADADARGCEERAAARLHGLGSLGDDADRRDVAAVAGQGPLQGTLADAQGFDRWAGLREGYALGHRLVASNDDGGCVSLADANGDGPGARPGLDSQAPGAPQGEVREEHDSPVPGGHDAPHGGSVADADEVGLGGRPGGSGGDLGDGDQAGRVEGADWAPGGDEVGLGDAAVLGRGEGRSESMLLGRGATAPGADACEQRPDDLGDGHVAGLALRPLAGGTGGAADGRRDAAGANDGDGGERFWGRSHWIVCHDGKVRRIPEPGFPLLVNGVRGRVAVALPGQQAVAPLSGEGHAEGPGEVRWINRVGAWKGFGNAIVPELGAEALRSVLDIMP